MKRTHLFVVLAVLASLVAAALPAAAQTPVATGAIGEIARMPVEALTGEASEVWLLRMTFKPGAELPAERQIGWSLVAVESGAVTFTSDQPLLVSRNGSTSTSPAGTTVVDTGAWTLLPPHATVAARNAGDAPASVLLLLVMSGVEETIAQQTAEAGGEAAAQQTIEASASPVEAGPPVGVGSQFFAAAGVEFGTGPGEMAIERTATAPGQPRTESTLTGVELGGIEQGQAVITVTSGKVLIWPGAMAGDPGRSKSVTAGGSATLGVNDGYVVLPGSTVTWTVNGGAPLVSLRARVVQMMPNATPAA